MVTKSNGNMT